MQRTRTVTHKIYVLTAEWADERRPTTHKTLDPDEADRLAENLLGAGAIRVSVEPFRVRQPKP